MLFHPGGTEVSERERITKEITRLEALALSGDQGSYDRLQALQRLGEEQNRLAQQAVGRVRVTIWSGVSREKISLKLTGGVSL